MSPAVMVELTRVEPYIGDKNKVLVNLNNIDWIEPRIYGGKLCSAIYCTGKVLTVVETVTEIERLLI